MIDWLHNQAIRITRAKTAPWKQANISQHGNHGFLQKPSPLSNQLIARGHVSPSLYRFEEDRPTRQLHQKPSDTTIDRQKNYSPVVKSFTLTRNCLLLFINTSVPGQLMPQMPKCQSRWASDSAMSGGLMHAQGINKYMARKHPHTPLLAKACSLKWGSSH